MESEAYRMDIECSTYFNYLQFYGHKPKSNDNKEADSSSEGVGIGLCGLVGGYKIKSRMLMVFGYAAVVH